MSYLLDAMETKYVKKLILDVQPEMRLFEDIHL